MTNIEALLFKSDEELQGWAAHPNSVLEVSAGIIMGNRSGVVPHDDNQTRYV